MNVDAQDNCKPDIQWNLNVTPWPWAKDESFSLVHCHHVMEHLDRDKWWNAFREIVRILMPDGLLVLRVPDASSKTSMTYRDHNTQFSDASFHCVKGTRGYANAWAHAQDELPIACVRYTKIPFTQYNWMRSVPWLLRFCADHLNNFIWEQEFIFQKQRPIGGS
ncbi:MAG: methyltransferase domain-containing protein [Desulfuromonadaceae bacterium]